MRVLMVLTSHDELGNTGNKTGFWLEEFAAPYYVFKDAGCEVTLASPKGGQPPLDPKSDEPDAQTDATKRFKDDPEAQQALANTLLLADMRAADFDAVFYPGGHGPLWDLTNDDASKALIAEFASLNKPHGFVCHAPAVLKHVDMNGEPLVKGKRVTAFTNSEEVAVDLTRVVPFLVEDMLKERGAKFERTDDWGAFALTDGLLVTGQNPASSVMAAEQLLALM